MTDSSVEDEIYDLGFYVQRCIRYHMRRMAFFLRCNRLTSLVGVLGGSAAAASLLTSAQPGITAGLALTVTFASAIDLVFGTGQRAALHNDLRKCYLGIEEEMMRQGTPSTETLRELRAKIRRIEADEPPTLPALELLARNDVIRALYTKDDAQKHLASVPLYMRLTAHWFEWDTSAV